MMDPEIKTRWVEALRSGRYEQGRKALRFQGEYCCLGVLCALEGWPTESDTTDPYQPIERLLGDYDVFVKMNDVERLTFPEIADYIEANL
jgi:hypothetical protein